MVSGILRREYYLQALEVDELLQELVPELPYTTTFWWESRAMLLAELDYLLEQIGVTYNQWINQHYCGADELV